MKLIQQPNDWSCVACSFAMTFNVSLDVIVKIIGHDGSEFVFENVRRGFAPMEMIYVGSKLGKFVMPLHTDEELIYEQYTKVIKLPKPKEWWQEMLIGNKAVLFLDKGKSYLHAVAYNPEDGLIYDPTGIKYPISDRIFDTETEAIFMVN